MQSQKRLLFLINPHAGRAAIKLHLLTLVDTFVKAGYQVCIHTSQHRGEVTQRVLDLGEDFDLVVCSGGDGTVNETINGLMGCARKPILGYIPAGTTNDFAATFGLPKHMARAGRVITEGIPTYFDVGRFNRRHFAYVAAFGAFTDITYQTPQENKNLLGKAAYILEAAARLPALPSYAVRIEHDDGVLEDEILLGLFTNSGYVAGVPVGKLVANSMWDGLMEVFLVKKPGNLLELTPVINSLLVGEIDRRHVHVFQTRQLKLTCQDAIPWTLDGEYGGTWREAHIENLPSALRLMIPPERIRE